jgi:hypothetical protein
MKLADKWDGYDDWLTRGIPDDDEPPLTDDERRQQRENERDSRWIEEIFR